MNRRIFTQRRRAAMFDVIGAVLLISAGAALLLSYFDVLIK